MTETEQPNTPSRLRMLRPRKTGPGFLRDIIAGGSIFVISGALILIASAAAAGVATVVFVKVLKWGGVL